MLRTPVFACVTLSALACGQSFEVASIKPTPPPTSERQMTGFQVQPGGRLNTHATTLRMLITFAYNLKDFQLSGGPGWVNSETYDITAKAAENAPPAQLRLMLQALLKDRFMLMVRQETKEGSIYELVVAKGGSKLQEDTTSPRSGVAMTGRGRVIARKALITAFLPMLETLTGRPVVDKTGLGSTYGFQLNWSPDPGEGMFPGPAGLDLPPADPGGPSLFTALQEQLGLRLQAAKGPVESLVIEGAARPSVD